MRLSMYTSLFSEYFSLNSEGFANILKTKNQNDLYEPPRGKTNNVVSEQV